MRALFSLFIVFFVSGCVSTDTDSNSSNSANENVSNIYTDKYDSLPTVNFSIERTNDDKFNLLYEGQVISPLYQTSRHYLHSTKGHIIFKNAYIYAYCKEKTGYQFYDCGISQTTEHNYLLINGKIKADPDTPSVYKTRVYNLIGHTLYDHGDSDNPSRASKEEYRHIQYSKAFDYAKNAHGMTVKQQLIEYKQFINKYEKENFDPDNLVDKAKAEYSQIQQSQHDAITKTTNAFTLLLSGKSEEAGKLFLEAAQQGDQNAQNMLGVMYKNGTGIPQNLKEAAKWFQKSAEQGSSDGQYNLGNAYLFGDGVVQDYQQAMRWFQKSADQGYPNAMHNIAVMYDQGTGVRKNNQIAFNWYEKAARKGYALSQYNLGLAYNDGSGVSKSTQNAAKWYREAAKQGLAEAQINLGLAYYNGIGVIQDRHESFLWLRKAAKQGYANAQYNVGIMYQHGIGVRSNLEYAYVWFLLAKYNGYNMVLPNLGVDRTKAITIADSCLKSNYKSCD